MTKHQELILNVIRTFSGHMTAEEIYRRCKEINPGISLATVYRNLGLLTERGLIAKVSINGQPEHYDRSVMKHEHVLCERCGKIADVSVGDMKAYLEQQTGLQLLSYDLCMRYVCPECQQFA